VIIGFKFHFLEVKDDVGHVLHHAGQRSELMLRPSDFCRGDGRAFQGGKQDTPEGIPNGVPIAGFKRLGGEFGVRICGCALVFSESFRHLKTTVTDWHLIFSNVDFRLAIEDRERTDNQKFENLKSKFLLFAGFPLASAVSRPATETQGPTA
jgi:hypothetical protein